MLAKAGGRSKSTHLKGECNANGSNSSGYIFEHYRPMKQTPKVVHDTMTISTVHRVHLQRPKPKQPSSFTGRYGPNHEPRIDIVRFQETETLVGSQGMKLTGIRSP